MKYMISLVVFFCFLPIGFAHEPCNLSESSAKALARIFMIDNAQQVENWVEFVDISKLSKKVVSDFNFSPEGEGAGYTFELASSSNSNQYAEVWIYVTCDGSTYLKSQFID